MSGTSNLIKTTLVPVSSYIGIVAKVLAQAYIISPIGIITLVPRLASIRLVSVWLNVIPGRDDLAFSFSPRRINCCPLDPSSSKKVGCCILIKLSPWGKHRLPSAAPPAKQGDTTNRTIPSPPSLLPHLHHLRSTRNGVDLVLNIPHHLLRCPFQVHRERGRRNGCNRNKMQKELPGAIQQQTRAQSLYSQSRELSELEHMSNLDCAKLKISHYTLQNRGVQLRMSSV